MTASELWLKYCKWVGHVDAFVSKYGKRFREIDNEFSRELKATYEEMCGLALTLPDPDGKLAGKQVLSKDFWAALGYSLE